MLQNSKTKEINEKDVKKVKINNRLTPRYVGTYILTIITGLIVIAPFYILIVTAITSPKEANYTEFHWWPQQGVYWKSFYDVLFTRTGDSTVLRGLWNTLWMSIPSVIVGILTSAMAAYAFAKMKFKAKSFMFSVLMFTMMFPNMMNMIASFMMFDAIGWVNTPYPMMIPRMFGTIGVIFFLKQFYVTLPNDLIEAAKIDGMDHFGIFWNIALPLSMPVMLAQFIFQFMSAYNEYTNALIYLQDARLYTLQLSLAFIVDPYTQNWPLRMAGVIVSLIPMLTIYVVAQKYITKGMAVTSGLKG